MLYIYRNGLPGFAQCGISAQEKKATVGMESGRASVKVALEPV